jgi:hypothetical protein
VGQNQVFLAQGSVSHFSCLANGQKWATVLAHRYTQSRFESPCYTDPMNAKRDIVYCYVDESGQDTAGRFFAVSILITPAEREELQRSIAKIERDSGKRNVKWKKSRPKSRQQYIEQIADMEEVRESLFVATYKDSKEYLVDTADAIAKSLRRKQAERAVVYVDALSAAEKTRLKRQLRPSVTIPTQVRGMRREENNSFIRLVDAICGLVRDANEGNEWAKLMVAKLKRRDLLKTL